MQHIIVLGNNAEKLALVASMGNSMQHVIVLGKNAEYCTALYHDVAVLSIAND